MIVPYLYYLERCYLLPLMPEGKDTICLVKKNESSNYTALYEVWSMHFDLVGIYKWQDDSCQASVRKKE